MADNLLTIREVMIRLKLSRTTIYNFMKQGQLKPIKIGKSIRFKESDIEALISQQQDFKELANIWTLAMTETLASLPEGTLELAA